MLFAIVAAMMNFCVTQMSTMKMEKKKYLSVGEAAKAVNTTSETLRHYDRIGLVKPSRKDEWTNYRYYTEHDIVMLNTIKALQLMDLSLQEIKKVLQYDNLEEIVSFLSEAEKKADEKIKILEYSKSKIRAAKADYERKLRLYSEPQSKIALKDIQERVILLSDTLETPTLDNLWNYLSHFYERIPPELKGKFYFEDMAGIYTEDGKPRLFALCIRHEDIDGIKKLPGGRYICATCTEDDREQVMQKLIRTAKEEYGKDPSFTVQIIIVSGILHWDYELQVYIG